MVVFAPLFALEILGLCHFLFIATHSAFAGLSVVAVSAFTALVPCKVSGTLALSWWVVFAPLLSLWTTWIASALHVLAHHFTDGGRVNLSRLQATSLCLFLLSLGFVLGGNVLFCAFLEQRSGSDAAAAGGRDSLGWAAAASVMVGGLLFSGPAAAICWSHLKDSVRDGVEVPRRLGTGWDDDVGREDWLCLGFVALKPGTGQHLQELVSCAACTSGRIPAHDDEEPGEQERRAVHSSVHSSVYSSPGEQEPLLRDAAPLGSNVSSEDGGGGGRKDL